jgi:RNA polymerase sigma-70 factor (ECF subfamily)
MVLKRFLTVEWRRANAQKRAGDRYCLPLPLDTAETRYAREPASTSTAEEAFEKQWALTLLETVLGELRAEYEQDGKGRLFETLKPSLMGSRELQPYASLAAKLEMSEGAVKVAVHRLRERYRERLKSQIAQTVASPEDIAGEMRHLIRVLGRS